MKLSCLLLPGILITMTIAVSACSKSGNGSKPKISIESLNNPVQPDESLTVNIKFTNGSKLSKGTFVAFRTRLNQIQPPNPVSGDTVSFKIPEFSAEKGELQFIQPYQGYLHFIDHINDTLVLKFAVIDVNGISSDTISSPQIIVINP
ncbi:hypothetical protein Q4E93_12125 [Flavitalea sp. BT771]|uniref:hypothetical protein n=1 Tax=Flavitalea sp. BT771 TaxID=3063329 RepID=UPI0026E21B19|nr:hypothetical protein [Flavitalea sp. BT771]MDO6431341.1 hypothetical protein [Flavitalea sp. BT771]MDV6220249.1 hypothetical protein [Flavitalea sp. BT771]